MLESPGRLPQRGCRLQGPTIRHGRQHVHRHQAAEPSRPGRERRVDWFHPGEGAEPVHDCRQREHHHQRLPGRPAAQEKGWPQACKCLCLTCLYSTFSRHPKRSLSIHTWVGYIMSTYYMPSCTLVHNTSSSTTATTAPHPTLLQTNSCHASFASTSYLGVMLFGRIPKPILPERRIPTMTCTPIAVCRRRAARVAAALNYPLR